VVSWIPAASSPRNDILILSFTSVKVKGTSVGRKERRKKGLEGQTKAREKQYTEDEIWRRRIDRKIILTSEAIPLHFDFRTLEALAMDNTGSGLVVLLLGAPKILEGTEGGENRSTNPDGVLSLGRSDDLDLHARRRK